MIISKWLFALIAVLVLVLGGLAGWGIPKVVPHIHFSASTQADPKASEAKPKTTASTPKATVPSNKAPSPTSTTPTPKVTPKVTPKSAPSTIPRVTTPSRTTPKSSTPSNAIPTVPPTSTLATVHSYAPGNGKTVALTFDDGPGPSTQAIIDILKQYKVPATFFNVGNQMAKYPTQMKEEAASFVLGDHTWDHQEMTKLNATDQAREIALAQTETYQLTGQKPVVFRPPYGSYNDTTRALVAQNGMTLWTWCVDTLDWTYAGQAVNAKDVAAIVSLAEAEGIKFNHPVILMHNPPTGTANTVAALPTIIKYFASHGYSFVSL